MALNPIDRLRLLHIAKDRLTLRRLDIVQDQAYLVGQAPGDIDTQAAALYAPMLNAFDNAITQVVTAINNVTITNADKAAYADAAIAAAKA